MAVSYNFTVIAADEISKDIQLGLGIYLVVSLSIGVVGNIMTMSIIILNKQLQTAPNCFIFNLAVADISLLAVNLPFTIKQFLSQSTDYNFDYCAYTSPINITTMLAALHSAGAVSFNRYLFLCKPKAVYKKFSSKFGVGVTIAAIWLWAFTISSPPLIGFGTYGYHSKFHTCFFIAYDLNSYLFGTIFCCCIGVFPVVLATMFFFKQIFAKIKQTTQLLDEAEKRRLKRQKLLAGLTNTAAISDTKPTTVSNTSTERRNRRTIATTLSISSTNLCSTCDGLSCSSSEDELPAVKSLQLKKQCSKISAVSKSLLAVQVSRKSATGTVVSDLLQAKTIASVSRTFRSKTRIEASPQDLHRMELLKTQKDLKTAKILQHNSLLLRQDFASSGSRKSPGGPGSDTSKGRNSLVGNSTINMDPKLRLHSQQNFWQ